MIRIANKIDCCGCGACAAACPKDCITMKEDNEGFLYPYVKKEKCISCNRCVQSCPIINHIDEIKKAQSGFIVQNNDEAIRKESTSGGAFTAISEYVIKNNGVVFGAAYTGDFLVSHIAVENKNELRRFRNSKYVQSQTMQAYKDCKKHLDTGRLVCFSGTPCQIEGLKAYLAKEYKNLITVDVVCHAVPSPLVFRKYIEMQKQKYGSNIKNILFRDI